MKKLLIYICVIVGVLAAVDVVSGLFARRYVRDHAMPGDYRSLDYLLKDFDDDALILGSSVALNSLDPTALGDSLGLTAYNGASNGQAFTYQLVMLKSVLGRHVPKTIFLGILPSDLATEGAGPRINLLSPYYGLGYAAVDSVLEGEGGVSMALAKSSLYRYNTIWFRILLYHFIEPGVKGSRGFIAKEVPTVFPEKQDAESGYEEMSERRRGELKEFMDLCRRHGIRLVVFFPPEYRKMPAGYRQWPVYAETRRMLENAGMTLYDDTALEPFSSDSTLFFDNDHLNLNGAAKYTDFFIRRLANDSIP